MAKRFDRTQRYLPRFVSIKGISAMGTTYEIIATPEGELTDGRTNKALQYPFDKLEVGQSFLIPAQEAQEGGAIVAAKRFQRIQAGCQYFGKKLGRKFRCKRREDGSIITGRIA